MNYENVQYFIYIVLRKSIGASVFLNLYYFHVNSKIAIMNRPIFARPLLARICNPCVIMARIANPRQRGSNDGGTIQFSINMRILRIHSIFEITAFHH